MTTTTQPSVDDSLLAKAKELVQAHGEIPSRNALKAGLKVGSDKATAVRDRLLAEQRKRRDEGRRHMRRIADKGVRTQHRSRSLTGLRAGFPAPTSPLVGPLVPVSSPQVNAVASPTEPTAPVSATTGPEKPRRKVATRPALLVALPASVAIWAGWVALGKMTGFGKVNLLPGIGDGWVIDTAITLPIGVEAYAAYAFYVALSLIAPPRARRFAAWSSGLAVVLGLVGQTAYHLMNQAGMTSAPWQITTFVSCLPVLVWAATARLIHLVRAEEVISR